MLGRQKKGLAPFVLRKNDSLHGTTVKKSAKAKGKQKASYVDLKTSDEESGKEGDEEAESEAEDEEKDDNEEDENQDQDQDEEDGQEDQEEQEAGLSGVNLTHDDTAPDASPSKKFGPPRGKPKAGPSSKPPPKATAKTKKTDQLKPLVVNATGSNSLVRFLSCSIFFNNIFFHVGKGEGFQGSPRC